MDTYVYVDGFNLYYGAVKNTDFKWLDIHKLCSLMFPQANIKHIHYFTALVNPRSNDTGLRDRQLTYFRALKTIPNLSITRGSFLTHAKRMPLVTPLANGTNIVEVWHTEEKGSDVNLAAYLVFDASQKSFQQALVISNDTDLAEAIDLVCTKLGLMVHVVNPRRITTAWPLRNVATSYRSIRTGVKSVSQFPDVIHDSFGVIKKPSSW